MFLCLGCEERAKIGYKVSERGSPKKDKCAWCRKRRTGYRCLVEWKEANHGQVDKEG